MTDIFSQLFLFPPASVALCLSSALAKYVRRVSIGGLPRSERFDWLRGGRGETCGWQSPVQRSGLRGEHRVDLHTSGFVCCCVQVGSLAVCEQCLHFAWNVYTPFERWIVILVLWRRLDYLCTWLYFTRPVQRITWEGMWERLHQVLYRPYTGHRRKSVHASLALFLYISFCVCVCVCVRARVHARTRVRVFSVDGKQDDRAILNIILVPQKRNVGAAMRFVERQAKVSETGLVIVSFVTFFFVFVFVFRLCGFVLDQSFASSVCWRFTSPHLHYFVIWTGTEKHHRRSQDWNSNSQQSDDESKNFCIQYSLHYALFCGLNARSYWSNVFLGRMQIETSFYF